MWRFQVRSINMNVTKLSHTLDRGAKSGSLRSKVINSNNQPNQQILRVSGALEPDKADARSLTLSTTVMTVLKQLLGLSVRLSGTITRRRLGDADATRPILMCFSSVTGIWCCSFYEDARRTRRLPRLLKFRDSAKVMTAARHGNADLRNAEIRRRFERDIKHGYGAIWLRMSDQQIANWGCPLG